MFGPDFLRAGRPRGWSSNTGGGTNFHFSMSSRPALEPTEQPGVKQPKREVDHSSTTA
jgi:hypothetical protein